VVGPAKRAHPLSLIFLSGLLQANRAAAALGSQPLQPMHGIPDHVSGRDGFGSGHVGLSGRKSCPALNSSHVWVGSGRVWSDFGFLVIIFGLSRVGSGYFLSSGENFGTHPTRRTVRSGRVFSGGSGRAAHDQI
jgi:hypothetical protein